MMPKLQKTKEVAGGSEMIGEEIKTEVSLEELRKITWDYSKEDIVGLYCGEVIRGFLWQAKECGDVNPILVGRCNVAEGWVEHFEADDSAAPSKYFPSVLKYDDGNPIKIKLFCKVRIELLDAEGNVIVVI